MRQIALLTVLSMLMSDVATADVVRHSSIPEGYWGSWVGAEESVIVLSANSYVSREANCSVKWVSQTAGARGSIYSAYLHCFGLAGRAGTRVTSDLIIWPGNIDQIAVGPDFKNLRVFRRLLHNAPGETGISHTSGGTSVLMSPERAPESNVGALGGHLPNELLGSYHSSLGRHVQHKTRQTTVPFPGGGKRRRHPGFRSRR